MTGRSVMAIVGVSLGLFAAHASPKAESWKVPRTPWNVPDFQGATWNFATMTPLERPRGIDKPELTADETVGYERDTAKARGANVNNGYDWWDDGSAHLDRRRTSLIIDPPDGHLPPLVANAQRRRARAGSPEGPEDFPLNSRCIFYSNAGPPMVPSPNNIQFVETRDYVVISNENIHDARLIPLDGRPHGDVPQWLGDSRGHWDGDTLVVDTVNLTSKTGVVGSDEHLHVVERFTATDANTLSYQFTVDDPTVWTRPWTALLHFRRLNEPIYEFACHEGNVLIMEHMLKVARLADKP
jgi:hypothetical protein